MNKLQLRAARPRTASTFHRRKASQGASRLREAVSVISLHHSAPARRVHSLRAQWFRNPVSGALECRWIADTTTEPPVRSGHVRFQHTLIHHVLRMPRRLHRARMRPPSR
jgi:hypothetical protein